ncbi:glycosyltransferase [Nostoc sp.]|uniref:glycosyltransferase n=1 Tax=Nostoc sp. TaxID=1180 RepID=UPI002FF4DCC8
MSQNIRAAKVSIIIPVLNEAGNIKEAIATTQPSKDIEVIIVDAGSEDGTVNTVQFRLNSLSKSFFLRTAKGAKNAKEEKKEQEEMLN